MTSVDLRIFVEMLLKM